MSVPYIHPEIAGTELNSKRQEQPMTCIIYANGATLLAEYIDGILQLN